MTRPTPKEISQRLAQQVERFAAWLLPNGKPENGEWCVGSPSGESGKSCKIRITGERAGVWCDFASNQKGDLLDLICACRGVTLGEAIRIAKDYLGIRDPESLVPVKAFTKPKLNPKGISTLKEESPVYRYLTGERKLTRETISAFKVAQGSKEIAFPAYGPSGDLLNVKYIGLERDASGKKTVRQEPGCAPALFGWQALKPAAREVVVTEGQIDAMTWHQMGFPALSIPDGVGNLHGWIDLEWSNLDQFDLIYLSFDNDKPGQDAVPKVAKRLGLHRCFNVILPEKDANDTLKAGHGLEVFRSAICASKPFTPQQIKSPIDFRDDVHDRFDPQKREVMGFRPAIMGGAMAFLPGETTLWTGTSGHGKSVLLSQIMLTAAVRGQRVAIASMEMRGGQTLHRMIGQSEGFSKVAPNRIDDILNWLSGKLWIYDVTGNVPPDLLFGLMEYSVARHRVDHIVIDSLMKCDIVSDDWEAQRRFMDKLTVFGRESGAHIHVVAHARKGRDESEAPGKLDVKGSSDLINQVDNVLSVWRNKEKEADNRRSPMPSSEYVKTPDAMIFCSKQRESGLEFEQRLWFRSASFSYFTIGKDDSTDHAIQDELLIPLRRGDGGEHDTVTSH